MTKKQGETSLVCPDCNAIIAPLATKCSQCGRAFSNDDIRHRLLNTKSDSKPLLGCLAILGILIAAGYWLFVPSAEEKAAKAQAAALEKRQAKHCLNPLDGSNYYVNRFVAQRLRNPDSYEHIKTNTAMVGTDGNHEFIVTYRAENGFGGMASGMAVGKFSNESCEVVAAQIVSN